MGGLHTWNVDVFSTPKGPRTNQNPTTNPTGKLTWNQLTSNYHPPFFSSIIIIIYTICTAILRSPQSPLLPVKLDELKLCNWVLGGILPLKLLQDKHKWLNNVKLPGLEGFHHRVDSERGQEILVIPCHRHHQDFFLSKNYVTNLFL